LAIILGIHDSPFDSGATIIRDGEVIAAFHEERIARVKHCGGFPLLAITELLNTSKVEPNSIDGVAVGFTEPDFIIQLVQHYLKTSSNLNPLKSKKDYYKLYTFEMYEALLNNSPMFSRLNAGFSNEFLRRMLKKLDINATIERVDHHLCHAASAFYSSGFKECLICTSDARGDGISTSLCIGDKNGIRKIASSPVSASMGHFYGGITELLDFGYADGEGKTEALAAFGTNSSAYEKLLPYISVNHLMLEGRISPHHRLISNHFHELLTGCNRNDIAWAAQRILEETYVNLITNAINELGIKNIALAGGIFLNVKLNQKIMEIPEVKDIFIHPAAGDTGVPTGAAFAMYSKLYGLKPKRWKHVFLGNNFSDDEIRRSLEQNNFDYSYIEDIGSYIGEEILPDGSIIGWFQNRMEYGPRALGARSVLIDPRNDKSPEKVRSTIKMRPAFQPFCPSIIKEYEQQYVINPKNIENPFMILAFRATQKLVDEAAAVVFIDSTTRVQTVERQYNDRYHDVLRTFGRETGVPVLLNTSFNRSGEPIVFNPSQAINDFKISKLDYLAIGHYLVKGRV
jgi:carbamoyltransferase